MSDPVMRNASIDDIIRAERGQVLATLRRLTGDFDLAEDALGAAIVEAVERWPVIGLPKRPGAWLTTVARRKALDQLRREFGRSTRERAAADALRNEPDPLPYHTVRDDQLRLIFTCCHPALARASQVALALRLLCGLTTTEIAAAFGQPVATVGQRISRAKAKIAAARIPYRIPPDHELPARLGAVLTVVNVVFTTGHHAPSGPTFVRTDLAEEAIRLARLLVDLMPDEPECVGLLALFESTYARRATRLDADGAVILLADADRRQWDHETIEAATHALTMALQRGRPGPFQIQAAISLLHSTAPDAGATDWPQIVQLYDALAAQTPSRWVRANRAVAVAQVEGPAAGLDALDAIIDADDWHLYHSARGELLRQLERRPEAAAAFRAALVCEPSDTDTRLLRGRLAEVEEG